MHNVDRVYSNLTTTLIILKLWMVTLLLLSIYAYWSNIPALNIRKESIISMSLISCRTRYNCINGATPIVRIYLLLIV